MRNKDIEVLSKIIGYCNDIEFLKNIIPTVLINKVSIIGFFI